MCCCVLAEEGKNEKYVGHFPELWFSGAEYSELVTREKLQRVAESGRKHKRVKRRRGLVDRETQTNTTYSMLSR